MLENQYVEISLQQILAIEHGSFRQICFLRMLFNKLVQPTVPEKMLCIKKMLARRDTYVAA
jgi:hypothetical protein